MAWMRRVVRPELLDELPAGDPRALRSRRDLRLINLVMGNERWIARQVSSRTTGKIVELGAGEGHLSRKLGPREVQACDLAPEPRDLPNHVTWLQGDVFERIGSLDGDVFVCCLILHHFERPQLRRLAEAVAGFQYCVFAEPWRARWPHVFGKTAWPFINDVTRHDMHVSIDAGFIPGELPEIFGDAWEWEEKVTLGGGLRSFARRCR